MSKMEELQHKRCTSSIRDGYAQILEIPLTHGELVKRGLWPGATWADAITLAVVRAAANGDLQAAREVRESVEGRAPTRVPEPELNEIRVQIIDVGKQAPNEDGTIRVPRSYDSLRIKH